MRESAYIIVCKERGAYELGNRTKDLRLLGRGHVDGYANHVDGVLTLYARHYP